MSYFNLYQALKQEVRDRNRSVTPGSQKKVKKVKPKQTKSPGTRSLTLESFFDTVPKKSTDNGPLHSPYPYKCLSPKDKIFYGLSDLDDCSQQSNYCLFGHSNFIAMYKGTYFIDVNKNLAFFVNFCIDK